MFPLTLRGIGETMAASAAKAIVGEVKPEHRPAAVRADEERPLATEGARPPAERDRGFAALTSIRAGCFARMTFGYLPLMKNPASSLRASLTSSICSSVRCSYFAVNESSGGKSVMSEDVS